MRARRIKPGLTKSFGAAAAAPTVLIAARPFSIRLTNSERETLKAAAGSKPLGVFARERLLDDAARRKLQLRPSADRAILGQILATLGRSGLASGLADLGKAARTGAILITPELQAQLQMVCADIREVRRMLIRALGLADERAP